MKRNEIIDKLHTIAEKSAEYYAQMKTAESAQEMNVLYNAVANCEYEAQRLKLKLCAADAVADFKKLLK